ncbi:alginate lyase family protein [Albidovulum sediminicola]|uniref:Alginate lyase family protein n=1 Tax=Albidovulum sediminicola TaxID=2984331 RepID=A0ABT2Z4I5_9RHOB|nr:alginate lyase family protein [Defluviimonas sp. WL0075]MCV2866055.1 alginate lyase family protein [Defluviimonas sp. WL0075]
MKTLRPLVLGLCLALPGAAMAQQVLNMDLRAAIADTNDFARYCAGGDIPADAQLEPVYALNATEEYGSDQATQDFAWAVMVLGGHALGGDGAARDRLEALLLTWANAEALVGTERVHDAVYALKRTLLPTIVSYSIIRADLPAASQTILDRWLGSLVEIAGTEFGGDVDQNNHRYLADSVLVAWGALTEDAGLLDKAEARLRLALTGQLREDGSWPLETRRGARALWYTRQSLSSLGFIIATLENSGRDVLADDGIRRGYETAMSFFLDGIDAPIIVTKYAAENYIPGPSEDYANQDMSFLQTRPHGRHYMAFLALADHLVIDPFLKTRIERLIGTLPAAAFPMIDEFSGGNASCFWGGGNA